MPTNPQPLEDRRAAKLCEECAISEQNGEESEEEAPTRERERDVGVKAWVGGGGGGGGGGSSVVGRSVKQAQQQQRSEVEKNEVA